MSKKKKRMKPNRHEDKYSYHRKEHDWDITCEPVNEDDTTYCRPVEEKKRAKRKEPNP